MIPYTLSDNSLTFFLAGYGQRTFRNDFYNYADLCSAVAEGNRDLVIALAFPKQIVAKISLGNVVISEDDEVLFRGEAVPDYLAQRILSHLKTNIPVQPLMAFAEKLMANPNHGVRDDLYSWLEKGQMPIYDDGDFMAYKLVSGDFTPIHKGGQYGQDQSVGKLVEQPRETCDEDRGRTCSSGLHFCSYDYLPHFGLGNGTFQKVIVLKISPTDVVAIPADYNDTKGRTCRFLVVDEIDPTVIKETFGNKLVIGSYGVYEGFDKKYDAGDNPPKELVDKYEHAEKAVKAKEAVAKYATKKEAATSLGISTKTLNRWLSYTTEASTDGDDLPECSTDDYDSWDSWGEEDENLDDLYVEDEEEVEADSKYDRAWNAINNHDTKKAAAESLGISTKTLNRWLNS